MLNMGALKGTHIIIIDNNDNKNNVVNFMCINFTSGALFTNID